MKLNANQQSKHKGPIIERDGSCDDKYYGSSLASKSVK